MSFTTDEKDCTTCPSFLTAEEARSFFGLPSIRVPMCAKFGYVMGKPVSSALNGEASEPVTKHWADKCAEYGKAAPASPTPNFQPVIFMPDTASLEKAENDTTVTSCLDCQNYFVAHNMGVAGCKPRGIILHDERLTQDASGCAWRNREPDTSKYRVMSPKLMPWFEVPVTVVRKRKPTATALFSTIDPVDSASDAPVAESMKDSIKAWRKVETSRGKEVFVPIFRTEFFSEERRELIPKRGAGDGDPSLYVDHSGLLEKFAIVSYKRDMMLTLVGEPGSGKTEGARWLAWQMNAPFVRLNYNEFSEPEQFVGQMGVKDGSTLVEPGELPLNWVQPGFLLSDEWNLPQEGIQQIYRSMNDASRSLKLYGQNFIRHDYCFHLTAINPAYDFRNIGAKELASADVRRLSYHFMPTPDVKTSKAIIIEAVRRVDDEVLSSATVDAILKISEDLKESSKQGKLPHHWTLSQDVKVARLAVDFDLVSAYRIAYFDFVDPQTSEMHLTMIKSSIPAGL